MQNKQGKETGDFGLWLTQHYSSTELHIFYDHGDRNSHPNVAAVKGFYKQEGEKISNRNRLADVDVIVASKKNEILLLIEIEERPVSPKKVLGDVFAIILCNRFAVRINRKQTDFFVTLGTKLFVAGFVPGVGHRLRKIREVTMPRLMQFPGLPGGIHPHNNIELIFEASLQEAIARLKSKTESMLNNLVLEDTEK